MKFIRSFVMYMEKVDCGFAFQTAVICDTIYNALVGRLAPEALPTKL